MPASHTAPLEPAQNHVDLQWSLRDRLPMWTVYRPTTSDFAGQWTARMHLTLPESQSTDILVVGASLEQIQQQLPPGMANIGRQPEDDPVIEEVWV